MEGVRAGKGAAVRAHKTITEEKGCHARTYRIGCIFRAHTGAIEKKADRRRLLSLPFAERVHQLLQLGCALDLEEHFIVVVGHLDVEVLDSRGGLSGVGHCCRRE